MKKLLGVLFIIFLVLPLIFSTLMIYSISSWAFDRNLYRELFTSEEVKAKLFSDEAIAKMLTEKLGVIEGIDTIAAVALVRSLVPEQSYTDQITGMVNQVFDFMEGKSETLTLQIDLSEIKAAFNGPNQQALLEELAKVLPSCQNTQAAQGLLAALCKPADISEEVFVEQFLKNNLPVLLAFMQNSISIFGPVTKADLTQNIPSFLHPYLNLASFRTTLYIFAGITLLLWILTALLVGSNGRDRLLWLGWMLILPALAVLIIGLTVNTTLMRNLLENGMRQFYVLTTAMLPFSSQEILKTLQALFTEHIGDSFTLTGGFFSAIGLGFIAWGAATHLPQTQDTEG